MTVLGLVALLALQATAQDNSTDTGNSTTSSRKIQKKVDVQIHDVRSQNVIVDIGAGQSKNNTNSTHPDKNKPGLLPDFELLFGAGVAAGINVGGPVRRGL